MRGKGKGGEPRTHLLLGAVCNPPCCRPHPEIITNKTQYAINFTAVTSRHLNVLHASRNARGGGTHCWKLTL